jgi:ribosomal protein L37AE/L43A
MAKKTRRGQKQCPSCKAWIKGTRAKNCPKCGYDFTGGAGKTETAPTDAAEAPTKAAPSVTLEQIKMVGQTVKTIGGFRRLHEMLSVIKEVGGVKRFKELLEAMEVTDAGEAKP